MKKFLTIALLSCIAAGCKREFTWEGLDPTRASCTLSNYSHEATCVHAGRVYLCVRADGDTVMRCAPTGASLPATFPAEAR